MEASVANPNHVPGKTGLLPRDTGKAMLVVEHYVAAGGLTAVPPATDVDRATRVSDWPMYCNGPDPANESACPGSPDGCGDCFWAACGHEITAFTAYAGAAPVVVPPISVIRGYSSTGYSPQTGENDNGTEPSQGLAFMRSTGLLDSAGRAHKYEAYAAFRDPTDEELLAQVLNTFGTVLLAVELDQAQEDQFGNGQPWTYVAGSQDLGGHMICLQRRAPASQLDIYKPVTWGALWEANRAFIHNQVIDAYAVVSADWIAANGTTIEGLDLQQLLADMPEVG
jgi:hypothetical protein